jgi:DNA-binding LytR/AlgR family response regulator
VFLEQLGGSLLFSIGHFCLLIAMRVLVHASRGWHYEWQGGLWYNLLFEYQKDVGIYALVVLIVSGYGYIQSLRVQLQQDSPGEAQLCVQTGRGESVIKLSEVDYLEAARNYVTVHSGDREYLLRETMANLAEQLQPHGFLRCHRSFLVNLEQVSEIRSKDSSGHEVALANGQLVPLSRGFKESFKAALVASPKPGSG